MLKIVLLLIPIVGSFLVGLVLWLIKRKRIMLEYDVFSSEKFPCERGYGRFFVIKLRNTGNVHIKDINFSTDFEAGEIETVRISSENLVEEVKQTTSRVECALPLLNPSEDIEVTITTFDKEDISGPKILARAEGATAKLSRKTNGLLFSLKDVATVAMLIALFGVVANTVIYELFDDNKSSEVTERTAEAQRIRENIENGKPEREQIIFGILNKAGLSHLFPDLMSSTGDFIPYWKTGLYLMHSFLLDQKNSEKYIRSMRHLAEISEMRPSSKGLILYLLGKMEQYQGNKDNAIKLFEQCKIETPLMYDFLMSQDPAYDLDNLQQWLLKNNKTIVP